MGASPLPFPTVLIAEHANGVSDNGQVLAPRCSPARLRLSRCGQNNRGSFLYMALMGRLLATAVHTKRIDFLHRLDLRSDDAHLNFNITLYRATAERVSCF